jgi:D-beta-D-heptose 7-phosphate kinase / D-beta-D-heptose 1-phosphate adenosyltransferase
MNNPYQSVIQRFSKQKVLVIGELMLDTYLSGTSNRICREAPVPIVNVQQREDMPGGAANAAVNLAAMGAKTTFVTVTGHDREGAIVAALLKKCGVNTHGIVYDTSRETITKKRVLADGQLIVRYDYGTIGPLSPECEQELIERLTSLYPKTDAVLVSDYGYGILSDKVIEALEGLQKQHPKLLVVDSKYLGLFHDLHPTAVKPNYQEAIQLLNLPKASKGKRVEQILANGKCILDVTGASVVTLTIDSEGSVIFEKGKAPYRTYAKPVPNSQAAGAGDTYVAALTVALSLGLAPLEAAELAAAAASVVVHKKGTATCSAKELAQFFNPPQKVIHDRDELADRVRAYREQGRKVVFTNGCFDILHRGHISYLSDAKALGDVLIVGVNSDESVHALKGPERPINQLDDRMQVLAALDCVDHVVSFDEPTSVELIKVVEPDVFVKGGDYTKDDVPEAPVVEELGGTVEILPYVADQSTTAVIEKIRAAEAKIDLSSIPIFG